MKNEYVGMVGVAFSLVLAVFFFQILWLNACANIFGEIAWPQWSLLQECLTFGGWYSSKILSDPIFSRKAILYKE